MRTDAIEMLKEDHRIVRELFEELEELSDDAPRQPVFDRLRDELLAHAFVEETVFYTALTQFDSLADLLDDSFEDHREMKDVLLEIEEVGVGSDEFLDQIEDLRDLVEEHVDIEEAELFPYARDVLPEDEYARLGQLLADARDGAKKQAA